MNILTSKHWYTRKGKRESMYLFPRRIFRRSIY